MIVRRAGSLLVTVVVGLLGAGARPASAQNLLVNPGFDGNANGWIVFGGGAYDGTHDFANNLSSGSAAGAYTIVTGATAGVVVQCVTPVTPGSFTLGASVLFTAVTAGGAGTGAGLLALQPYSDTACATPNGSVVSSNFPTQTNGAWQTHSFSGTIPAGTQSVIVGVGGIATIAGGAFIENVDNVDLEQSVPVPAMSAVWLTLLAVGCALAVLVMQQRRAVAR